MNCSEGCSNGGVCSVNNTCVCTPCFAGISCEIDTNVILLSMTSLMLRDIQQAEMVHNFNWPKLIYSFSIAFLLVISIMNNILSLQTFMRYEIRQTNCGVYQILFSLTSLMTMITLQLRMMAILWFDYLTEAYAYRFIACNIITVIAICMSQICMWISTLLVIEFILLECFNFNLNRSRRLSIILSIVVILAVLCSHIDEFFSRLPLPDPYRTDLYTCIFTHKLLNATFDNIIRTCHIFVPSIIQIIASLCILISTTKRIGFVYNRYDFIRIFFEECLKRKSMFVPMLSMVLLNTPDIIFHLKVQCADARDLLKIRLHVAFIILIYLSLSVTFFIYIYPSPSYVNHFKKTSTGRLLKKMFDGCKRKEKVVAFP